MKKTLLLFALIASFSFAQEFKIVKISGTVKAQFSTKEEWKEVKVGDVFSIETIISTAKFSSAAINTPAGNFTLKESSALSLSRLKKMTLDELILALAMEDITAAKQKRKNGRSRSTAVYGTDEEKSENPFFESNDFGIKKLNGAVQLAQSGLKESAVLTARETFGKYPASKNQPSFRIYFASVLNDLGLYEEAYKDFEEIKQLQLNDEQKKEIELKIENLKKKLSLNK